MDSHQLALVVLSTDVPVIAVVAPPGYGKSTLLSAWAQRRGPRLAWVSCDQVEDDAQSVWSAVATSLGVTLEPASTDDDEPPSAPETGDKVIDRLIRALGESPVPAIVVLDHVESLSSRESRRSVAAFARAVPAGWTLALASREEVPLPTARMRVERRLLEIGVDDLALTSTQASGLLAAVGVELSQTRTAQLTRDVEGWPAALYLAALAIQSGEVTADRPFTGTERLMADYLRSEVLDSLSRADRRFLVRTSILERVCTPLADAILQDGGATRILERLPGRNLLVLPDDLQGEWFRYHRFLRQLLQAELRSEDPELVRELHAHASTWFESQGDLEDAIDHAYQAGDEERFGRLVLEAMQPVWASGQIGTVESWMQRLGSRSPAPHTPAMIAHGALIFALLGRPGDAERWTAVAESLPATGTLADGSTVAGTLAYARANLARQGPAVMREDALAALEGLGPTSPYRATMIHTEGLSYLLEGDLDRADASFAHAYDLATSLEASPVAALVLAEQFLVAVERDEWPAAESLVKRALEIVGRGPFEDYWTSALVFAAAAHAAAQRGDMADARELAGRAARLRPLLTYALPVVSLQALVELARAYLALVDPAGAKAVVEQVRGILLQRPDLGTLATAARALDERVAQITAATPVGASSLTAAELRLVPLLPTHLSYPEIGERLFISRHTVKTQAGSIYRKLGASSRKEAVERMTELGLV
jgi:LuxR family transcriptional regulator, maltose regulon positive regulatory protein